MTAEERLAILEIKLRRTRLLLGAILGGLVVVCTLGADDRFPELVGGALFIKNPGGKTVIELKDSGELKADGGITAKGVDILAELKELKNRVGAFETTVAGLRTELACQLNKIRVKRVTHKLNSWQTPEDVDFGQPVERAEVVLSGIWLQRRNDEAGDFGWKPFATVKGNIVQVTFQRMGLGGHDASEFDMTVIAWLK